MRQKKSKNVLSSYKDGSGSLIDRKNLKISKGFCWIKESAISAPYFSTFTVRILSKKQTAAEFFNNSTTSIGIPPGLLGTMSYSRQDPEMVWRSFFCSTTTKSVLSNFGQ